MKKPNFLKRLSFAINQTAFERYLYDYNTGKDVSPSVYSAANQTALAYSGAWACSRVLAETFGSVPVFEYMKKENGDREATDDTGLFPILHNKPNDEMSAYNWAECMMYQLNSGGNAISIRELNRFGGVTGLIPIEWERIKIERNRETNKLIYEIDGKKKYTRDQVLHVPGPSMNGVIGMSVLEFAASAVRLGLSYEGFGNKFFKNGAMPSGVFEKDGKLSDEAFKRLADTLKTEYTGLENSGTPMLLEDGLKFNQMTMKLVDAEFLSSRKFQTEEICRFFRVPLHLVQSLDRATNNNIEHQSLEFVMYTMLPHFKRFEQCINTQLMPQWYVDNGYYFEYNINALVRGDMKSRFEAYGLGRQWGFLSVNDIRRLENLPRITNGDIYMQPVNMVEAGKQPVVDIPVTDDVKREIENILR